MTPRLNSTSVRPGRMAWVVWPLALVLVLVLAACAQRPTRTVSVEDRPVARAEGPAARPAPAAPAAAPAAAARGVGAAAESPAASSMAGRPGFYTVKPGDTLVKIGLDHGRSWRDIARWNQIENPNLIEVGQVLRVAPDPAVAADAGRDVARTARGRTGAADAREPSREPQRDGPREVVVESPRPAVSSGAPRDAAVGELSWAWPASGPVLQGFDEQRNKGVDIGGKAGDPVLAAADGRVAYAGSALRGYGNLVILQHNANFLSAYAHNQTLLVKEDQVVRKGQKIAEMGSSDAERVQLHFEIRRDGKPVDPLRLLPPR